jgi:hypothetical protein
MSETSSLYRKSVKGEQINGENMFRFPRTEVDRLLDDAGKQREVLEENEIEVCVHETISESCQLNSLIWTRE